MLRCEVYYEQVEKLDYKILSRVGEVKNNISGKKRITGYEEGFRPRLQVTITG